MKKLMILVISLGLINTPIHALHRTYIYLTNNTTMTNPIWAYLPYAAGATGSTASVPSDFPTTHWGTDYAVASGSTSIASGTTGTITSGNYNNDTYLMRVRIKTDSGDEVSFTPMMKYGNSLFGTSQYPAKFPGEWVEGDYTTLQKAASVMPTDPSKPYGLPPTIKKTFSDGKVYTFLSQFIYNADDTNSKYTTTNWATNWPSLLADLTIPPVTDASSVLIQQAQDQQASATNAPAILQSGSFANITNNLTVNYQIKDKQLPPIIGGGTTNTTTLWGSANTIFNTLWDGSKTLTFEPDDQTFPSFTFAFSENYSNIAITRGSVGAQAGTSSPWTINMTPLISALSALSLPLPKQWSIDFTIDENWNIIVNALKLECHTFAVVSNAIQETVHNFVLSARSATYSTSVNGVITTQTVPASLSGGLCGLSILLANNPTCTAK